MKKQTDPLTKAKRLYCIELGVFAVLFMVLGLLFLTGVISVADWKRWAFAIVTLAGGVWLVVDFFWTLGSKKRRAKNCLLDKVLVFPMALCVIAFDILSFVFGWVSASGEEAATAIFAFRIAIGVALCYYALVYAFQTIYHWYRPVPMILEAAAEEEAEKKKEEEAKKDASSENEENRPE